MELTLIYRSKVIITAYKGWISRSARVLDIGCGNGVVTEELRRHFRCPISGTDLLDYRKREFPFKLMTAKTKLPFTDNEFDICMFNDALHHCDDQESLLIESIRVAKRILIFEMEPTIIAKIAEVLINQIHNPTMNIPFNIRPLEEWQNIFDRMNFNYECRRLKKPSFLYPFVNFSFNLTKSS